MPSRVLEMGRCFSANKCLCSSCVSIDRLLSLVRHRDTLLKEKEIEINELQAKMQAEMNELQAKMQAKINELNVEINSLKRAAEEQVILRVDFSGEDNVEETPSEAPKIDTMKVPASSSLVAAKSDSPRESDVSPKFDLGSEYHIYADGTQDQSFQEKLDSLMNEVIHQLNANQGSFLGYSEASDLSVEQQTQVSEAYGKLVAVAKKILVKVVSKQFENIGLDLEFIEEVKTEVMEAIGNIMAIVDA